MPRTTLALAATAIITLALASGCKHNNGERAGTTTIRSGTPDGVRVTSAPDPASEAKARSANRLAAAVCERQRRCASTESTDARAEAALPGETICVADVEPRARQNVEAWPCSPAVARAGFEECLAAVATEGGCEAVSLTEDSEIRACRPSEICRKGAGVGTP